jgi:hypothetical protein
MAKLWKVVSLLVLVAGAVAAQDAPVVTQHFKPGDTLRYLVRFEGIPELSALSLSFGIRGTTKKDQAGFSGGFTLRDFKPLSTGGFEVTGVIPKEVGTGTYDLTQVYATHPPAARAYSQGELPKITIEIVNDAGYEFPPLKSITPN